MNKKYKVVLGTLLALAMVFLAAVYLLNLDIAVLNPKGLIALKQRHLLILATFLMLIIVIPVFILTFLIAWKYRASNAKAKYTPDWDKNHLFESIWWGFPCAIVLVLSIVAWKSCHELDPFKPLNIEKAPLRIQVVALQWKWLFIYPEQQIASVNFFQFPVGTPLNFEITSDAPMNAFWIPELGGQIYAMSGMRTKLHLIADEEGNFRGSSANISGEGFSGMTFIAKSSSQADFDRWVESVREGPHFLNAEVYQRLAEPSSYVPVESYVLKDEGLFDQIVKKYLMPVN